jgi:serine phosphatase RsbU (regulator of sigma subunit)
MILKKQYSSEQAIKYKNMASNILYKYACIILLLILSGLATSNDCYGQVQPLSRNDDATITKALKNYETNKDSENWNEASRYINEIANLYWEHNQYQKAIEYFEISLELNQKIGNENGVAMIHNNLGMLTSDIGQYEKSIAYLNKTLAARRAFKNKEGIIAALKNISVAQNNLGMYDKSIVALQEALALARETNDPDQMAGCFLMLAETYDKSGNATSTMYYYERYKSFYKMKQDKDLARLKQIADEDAILVEMAAIREKQQNLQLNKLKSELNVATEELNQFDADKIAMTEKLNKVELQIKILETEKENERLRSEEKLREEKALRNLILLGALSFLLLSFFIYRNYRQEKKSKKVLAIKNDQIQEQNEELESLNKIIAKHNKRMQSELDVGREIQMSMLPNRYPDIAGVDLYASLIPAREVGGDLYEFYELDDDHIIFGIGDVSDKGVPAALFMAVTKTLIKTNANYSRMPGKILTQVNRQFSKENDTSMFVTYFLGILNTKNGELVYSNAGHNPPLWIQKHLGITNHLKTIHGPVLGAAEDFEYAQGTLTLGKGDQLILFTDGVTEAINEADKFYSEERLDDLFKKNGTYSSKKSVEHILSDVRLFRGEKEQSDDITILSLIFQGNQN